RWKTWTPRPPSARSTHSSHARDLRSMTHLPTLEAVRVRLRWLEERDVDALFAVFSDSAVTRYWSRPAMTQLSEAEELLADVRAGFDSGGLFQWGVERRLDDKVIGTCTLFQIDTKNRRAEVGYA